MPAVILCSESIILLLVLLLWQFSKLRPWSQEVTSAARWRQLWGTEYQHVCLWWILLIQSCVLMNTALHAGWWQFIYLFVWLIMGTWWLIKLIFIIISPLNTVWHAVVNSGCKGGEKKKKLCVLRQQHTKSFLAYRVDYMALHHTSTSEHMFYLP